MNGQFRPAVDNDDRGEWLMERAPSSTFNQSLSVSMTPASVPFLQSSWAPHIGLRPASASLPPEIRSLWPPSRPSSAQSARSDSSNILGPMQHLITPLGLEAILEGARVESVRTTGPVAHWSMGVAPPQQLFWSEQEHRAHVCRSEERDIVRIVRAFMAAKERAQFLARERQLEQKRQGSFRGAVTQSTSIQKPPVRPPSGAIHRDHEDRFIKEEKERTKKRMLGWLSLCQDKEMAARAAIQSQETKQMEQITTVYNTTIGAWLTTLATVCEQMGGTEMEERQRLEVEEESTYQQLCQAQTNELPFVGLLESEAIVRAEVHQTEEADWAAMTSRFYKGCGALHMLATNRLKELEIMEQKERKWILQMVECHMREGHQRLRCLVAEHKEFLILRHSEACARAITTTTVEEQTERHHIRKDEAGVMQQLVHDAQRQKLAAEEATHRRRVSIDQYCEGLPWEEEYNRRLLEAEETQDRVQLGNEAEEDARGLLDVAEWRARSSAVDQFNVVLEILMLKNELMEGEMAGRHHLMNVEEIEFMQFIMEAHCRAQLLTQQQHQWQMVQVESTEVLARGGIIVDCTTQYIRFWYVQQTLRSAHSTEMEESAARQVIFAQLMEEGKVHWQKMAARRIVTFFRCLSSIRSLKERALQRKNATLKQEEAELKRHVMETLPRVVAAAAIGVLLRRRAQLLHLLRQESRARRGMKEEWGLTTETIQQEESQERSEVLRDLEERRHQWQAVVRELLVTATTAKQGIEQSEVEARAALRQAQADDRLVVNAAIERRVTLKLAIPMQALWRTHVARRKARELQEARERREEEQLRLWACTKLQAMVRMQKAKAEKRYLEHLQRLQALEDQEEKNRTSVHDTQVHQRSLLWGMAQEDTARVAALQLERREWGVLLQFWNATRKKFWDQVGHSKALQQKVRALECEEREQRRAIMALYPSHFRSMQVEFECFFFGLLALQENQDRVHLMKEEQVRRSSFKQRLRDEYPAVVARQWAGLRREVEELEITLRTRLLDVWQTQWNQIRVAANLEFSKIRVTTLENHYELCRNADQFAGSYDHVAGHMVKISSEGRHRHQQHGYSERRLIAEAWANSPHHPSSFAHPMSRFTTPPSYGSRVPSPDALPELFASSILKKEMDARMELLRKEEEMRDSLIWSMHRGVARTPPADLFRIRGLSSSANFSHPPTPPSPYPLTPPGRLRPPSGNSYSMTSPLPYARLHSDDVLAHSADSRQGILRPLSKLTHVHGSNVSPLRASLEFSNIS